MKKGTTKRRQLPIGQKVHIDIDHPEWGRVASDGIIMEQHPRNKYLVEVASVRANLIVDRKDMWVK